MPKRWWRFALAVVLGLTTAIGGLAPQVPAPLGSPADTVLALDMVISTCNESGFSAALDAAQAEGGGTLRFDCGGPVTIPITSEKTITGDVTIIGDGLVTFRGSGSNPLFFVEPDATLELFGLTLENGTGANYGGAVYNGNGTLAVVDSTFNGNSGEWGGAIYHPGGTLTIVGSSFNNNSASDSGGAIAIAGGTATIVASTFDVNSATSFGGAIDVGGGVVGIVLSDFSSNIADASGGALATTGGSTFIGSSTFQGNIASSSGGAIVSRAALTVSSSTFNNNWANATGGAIGNAGSGELEVTSSTIAANVAGSSGGAIDNTGAGVTLKSSIVANNNAASGPSCAGPIASSGSNVSNDDLCGLSAPADTISSDFNLAALADNGGPTLTMMPGSGSDVIGAASCSQVSSPDQRGAPRPGSDCDSGAVEVGATVPVRFIAAAWVDGQEGDELPFFAVGTGPAGATLDYDFDCDNSGSYETQGGPGEQIGDASVSISRANCTLPDDGKRTVGVRICDDVDPSNCATATIHAAITNVAPTLNAITTNAPVTQGQPVTVTVDASDPGIADILSYSFDCDDDGTYDVGPQTQSSADCMLPAEQASTTINVLVEDGDGGSDTGSVTVSQAATVCANRYTGQVSAPAANGSCSAGSVLLNVPAAGPTTLCINPYTGAISWSPRGACGAGFRVHVVPDDGPLVYCQSRFTGQLRYSANGQCGAYERPGVIPGA